MNELKLFNDNEKWYTLQQLSELLGLGIDSLNHILTSNKFCNQLQSSDICLGGYHNTQKFYSQNILEALKKYQIKNSTPNALKNKQTALVGNAVSINNMTTQEVADVLNIPCDTIQAKARELGFVKNNMPKDWYTIEQLSDLLGLGIDRLNQLLPSLCNQLQSEIKTVGKEHRKLYSGDVLKALKEYQIKNSTPNALKNKQTAIEGNISYIENITLNKLNAAKMTQKLLAYYNEYVPQLEATVQAQKQQLLEQQPKIDVYNRISNSEGLFSINQCAKALQLGYGNITLYKKLVDMKIIMNNHTPYQQYVNNKYFVVKTKYISAINKNIPITLITNKGLIWLAKQFNTTIDKTVQADEYTK